MTFDKGQPFVQLQTLIVPFVFKAVECIEQAEVKHVDQHGNGGDWNAHGKYLALDQENRLHHNSEDRVCHRNGE